MDANDQTQPEQWGMDAAARRLRFSVEFSQMHLDRVLESQAQLDSLFSGLADVVMSASSPGTGIPLLLFAQWNPLEYITLQAEVRRMLEAFVDHQVVVMEINKVELGFATGKPVVQGNIRDAFLMNTWRLLVDQGKDRVGRCQPCGRIFFKLTTRAKFCSRGCATRAGMRKLRAKRNQEAHHTQKR